MPSATDIDRALEAGRSTARIDGDMDWCPYTGELGALWVQGYLEAQQQTTETRMAMKAERQASIEACTEWIMHRMDGQSATMLELYEGSGHGLSTQTLRCIVDRLEESGDIVRVAKRVSDVQGQKSPRKSTAWIRSYV